MHRPAPTLADPFADLSAQQRDVVGHGAPAAQAGPLLVIAGAGSGKTTTLAARLARLVLEGVDPQRILLLTFSRRAAGELERRAAQMLHVALGLGATTPAPRLPWAGTFHGIGARLIRDHAAAIGIATQFTVIDRGDAEDLMGMVRQQLGLAATAKRFPTKATCLAICSRVLNSQAPVDGAVASHFPWCLGWEAELKQLFRAFGDAKAQQQLLDYDDLLAVWHAMMLEPTIAAPVRARFDHVLVDEYQDTNRLQAAILAGLAPGGHGLTVVGDDAQAIYSFRAAEVRNILDFPAQFTPPARVLALTRNYRSTQAILAASNAVIAQASRRFAKELWSALEGERPELVTVDDEMAQARWVADRALAHREGGLALKQQAVLFRTGHHSAVLEIELARRGIPFVKFGGLKFLEAAHVKDLLSVLRWVQNPRSRLAGFRVSRLIPGIGPAASARLLDAMAQAPDPLQAMRDFQPPAAARDGWQDWLQACDALCAGSWPDDVALAQRWYLPHLERLHDDAAARRGDLAQLAQMAAAYPGRERFLAELTLDPPQATSDEAGAPHRDDDYLVLSTMHSAKGQEWTAVSVLNVVDGCIPSDMATGHPDDIDEERRLLYVAMTRAKRHLALLMPQRFYVTQQGRHGDRHLYGGPSRFITADVAACCQAVGPAAPQAADCPPQPAKAPIDIRARLRGAF